MNNPKQDRCFQPRKLIQGSIHSRTRFSNNHQLRHKRRTCFNPILQRFYFQPQIHQLLHFSDLPLQQPYHRHHCSQIKDHHPSILSKYRQRSLNCSNSKKTTNFKNRWWNRCSSESGSLRVKMLNSKNKKHNFYNILSFSKTPSRHTSSKLVSPSLKSTSNTNTTQWLTPDQYSQSSNLSNQSNRTQFISTTQRKINFLLVSYRPAFWTKMTPCPKHGRKKLSWLQMVMLFRLM